MNESPELAYDPIEPSASSVITELNRVLGQALDQIACEERLDLAYEVMETVRFEHSHISWLDRLRNTSGQIEIRIPHTQLPVVQAEVSHLANPFLILSSSRYQYFVNSGLRPLLTFWSLALEIQFYLILPFRLTSPIPCIPP